ncbi:hypothetical protein [Phenylobacterium sp.]|jgi:hypothetical protein|uniref:hypothetical protein n=1 Tax=Phenylobacterium sp. TaxID=1871053 RepID=UPI002ED977AF
MPDFDTAALLQRWTHSHEEDTPGRMVFRPGGWRFPPSRGRRSFELGPDGALLASGPGPTDKTVVTDGRWRLREDGVLELEQQGRPSELRLVEVAADKLVVER